MKKDGHTHTEYCPHGTIEDVEVCIQKAIQLGFTSYSLTEHAPLPKEFIATCGGQLSIIEECAMAAHDLDHYFAKGQKLQKKYASEIQIELGFELDYLPGFESYTRDLLAEYHPLISDGLLSVHFLPGVDGIRCIDLSAADYQAGIVAHYGSFQAAQKVYYQTILASIEADLGPYKPKRYGHLSLCQKFQHAFDEETSFHPDSQQLIQKSLHRIAASHAELDLNTAGLFKPDCLEIYPSEWIRQQAAQLTIPTVYGSDTHALADVGRGYQEARPYLVAH